ncbi:phosphoribosylanthranilate isomerase [Natronospora cellulosivora (SeqCode)]
MHIKICGLTRKEDVDFCSHLGINALGFILADSPRSIEIERVAEITRGITPLITKVAVVMNPSKELLERVVNSGIFECIQFHGEEDPELISNNPLKSIKAISIDIENNTGLEKINKYKDVDCFLFDSKIGKNRGGIGSSFNWDILNNIEVSKPYILAGGLGPDNIYEALSKHNFHGIDLNSKLEIKAGIKDHNLIKESVRIIRDFQLCQF